MTQKHGCDPFPPYSPLPGLEIRCLKVLQGRKDVVTGSWQLDHWPQIISFFISTQEILSFCVSEAGSVHPKEGSLGGLKAMTLWGWECAVLG